MKQVQILIVDDESIIRRMLSRVLADEGYSTDVAENGKQAFDKIKTQKYDLVITDFKMPEMGGLELLEKSKAYEPSLEFIVITGFPTAEAAVEVMKLGAADFICKPFDLDVFINAVEKCLLKRGLQNDFFESGELDIFLNAIKLIATETKLEDMMEGILDCALKLTNTLCGYIALFSEAEACLRLITMRGLNRLEALDLQIKFDRNVLKELFDVKLDIALPAELETNIKKQLNTQLGFEGLFTAVILRSLNLVGLGGGLLGVICVSVKNSSGDISEREKRLLDILAAKISIAFENKKLLQKLNEKNII